MANAVFNVEATALFYDRPQPDVVELLGDLNQQMSNEAGCYMSMSPLSHADWWLLSCEKFHIMISFANEAADQRTFQKAVTSPVTSLRRFDYTQAVQSHRAHMHVEIGDGNAPLPPEARIIMQEFGSAAECDPALKMKALHWTSQFIARHVGFLALHFAPSDRLFCPDELSQAAGTDFPTALLTHPIPALPVPGPSGVEGWSLTLCNPRHLPGRAIELEGIPVPVPLATAVQLINTLFAARAKGKMPLNHGDILTPSKKWALYVRHGLATEDAPEGRAILSFWDTCGHDAPAPVEAVAPEAPVAVQASVDAPAVAAQDASAPAEQPELAELAPVAPRRGLAGKLSRKARRAAEEAAQNAQAQHTAMEHASHQPEPEPQDDFDLVPTDDAQLYSHEAGENVMADLYYDTDAPEEVASDMPRLRDGLGLWLKARLSSIPAESRVKVAGFAIILGLPFVWNPYGDFTGGIDAMSGPHLSANAKPNLPAQALFAALN